MPESERDHEHPGGGGGGEESVASYFYYLFIFFMLLGHERKLAVRTHRVRLGLGFSRPVCLASLACGDSLVIVL